MFISKQKRHLFIPLIGFTLIVTIVATIILVRLVNRFSSDQIRSISKGIVMLMQGNLEHNLKEESLMLLLDFHDQDILSEMREAKDLYNSSGTFTFRNIFGENPFDSRSARIRELFGDEAELELYLISEKGIVITSSDEGSIGTSFYKGTGKNRDELNAYLSQVSPGESLILFDHREKDLELDLFFPLELFVSDGSASGIIIAAAFSRLDIYRTILEGQNAIDGFNIFIVNSEGQFYQNGKTRGEQELLANETLKLELVNFLKQNRDTPVILNFKATDNEGNQMIVTGVWITGLETGIIISMKSSEILSPWIYLAFLIITVMVACFLLFLIVLIYIDTHRMKAYNFNPITHLPGNQIIEKEIAVALKKRGMMVIYCDLDNFKAYNDCYGFTAGDDVIAFSAGLLVNTFVPRKKFFIGHIGGDDFVVIGKMGEIEKLCDEFGRKFDREIASFYNDTDRKRGAIEASDRQGKPCRFPFIAMSMGGVPIDNYSGLHPLKIAEICSEVKREAKKVKGSRLVIDKRHGTLQK